MSYKEPRQLKALSDLFAQNKRFIEVVTAKNAEQLLKKRVFNRGQAADGSKMISKSKNRTGAYSKGYGRKRKSLGYRTDVQDMQFKGDLLKDIKVVEEGGVVMLKIVTDSGIKKAMAQETRQNKTVFKLSSDERQTVLDDMKKTTRNILTGRK